MSAIGAVHFVFSLLAIVLGAVVILLPKGTRWHRSWGHGYAWSMTGVVVTSFVMYNLTGRITPFHAAALVAGLTIAAGMGTVLLRKPRKDWLHVHAELMAWSYVGLIAAFVAESATRFIMPAMADSLSRSQSWQMFWALVAGGSLAVVAVGRMLIKRRLPGAIASVPAAKAVERTGEPAKPTTPVSPVH